MKVQLTLLLETSTHDGYCSGEESEYKAKNFVRVVKVPKEYSKMSLEQLRELDHDVWRKILPTPPYVTLEDSRLYLSGCCHLDNESRLHGIAPHEFRYTIISIDNLINDKRHDEKMIGLSCVSERLRITDEHDDLRGCALYDDDEY